MKAIMISIKPEWCVKIMNGKKTIEVRKNKALANAIQKLIDENGYIDIYVYCSKDGYNHLHKFYTPTTATLGYSIPYYETNNVRKWEIEPEPFNGKVAFKFRCYKIVEARPFFYWCIEKETCLTRDEVLDYLDSKDKFVGNPKRQGQVYAIHINDLEIFDEPKELSEFYTTNLDKDITKLFDNSIQLENGTWVKPLTKAPQNFCYMEVE